MINYKEILRYQSLGLNNTQIAAGCGCSRNSVISTLRNAKQKGLDWVKVQDWSDSELADILLLSSPPKSIYKMPDYQYVHREMQKSGTTLTLLWLEYCDQCRSSGEVPYKTTQFNKYYHDYLQKTKATFSLNHKPGEVMQVDWAGQTAFLVDSDNGELVKAFIFVAVLPYSGYTYSEAFIDQKEESWINAHVNAYRYFGGVSRILIPDNLKTGISKNTREETVINRAYQEMASHYSTAILPARPRKPKDKGAVEGTVGNVSIFITSSLRNQQFFTIQELNKAIGAKLVEFNHKPFQKKEGSRASVYEEEKSFLIPLPSHPYELARWKTATVQFNYHICVDSQNYSCPYECIKQTVNVRMTKTTIEVFLKGSRIASHIRLSGRPNQYSTYVEHMPPNHQQFIQWNGKRFLSWAEKIGTHAVTVVQWFLSQHTIEQQGYKACMGLLRLADKYTSIRLENACSKALSFTSQPSLKSVQAILRSGQDKIIQKMEQPLLPSDLPLHGFTRGAGYYALRKEEQC